MEEKRSVYSFTSSGLREYLGERGFRGYRASQIFKWVYAKGVYEISAMTDISLAEREKLEEIIDTSPPHPVAALKSESDRTVKFAFESGEGIYESVLMPGEERTTVCLSSQTGCALGCRFCATGRSAGRNMDTGEIIGQYARMQEESASRITNVVFMGMGEPMLNLENVLRSAEILNDSSGAGIGARRITISTAGITEGIIELADFPLQVKLAVSLNSAIQKKREYLMPVAARYPLDVLASSLTEYQKKKKRRITFEYILLHGVNDGDADVEALRRFTDKFDCKVNIIPYNGTFSEFREPDEAAVEAFKRKLSFMKDAVSVRVSRGRDIAGACGQLKGKIEEERS